MTGLASPRPRLKSDRPAATLARRLRARRHLAVGALGALVFLAGPAAAGAGTGTWGDPNDVAGRLDIRWVRQSAAREQVVHTLGTYGPFSSSVLGGANTLTFVLDTNNRWRDDAERSVVVFWQRGALRAVVVDKQARLVGSAAVARPSVRSVRVSIPVALVGRSGGYRWFAATVDGNAGDFAPNRGSRVHDYTPPTITLRSFPRAVAPPSDPLAFSVGFAVADTGLSWMRRWRLERRLLGTTAWSLVRSGPAGGRKRVSVGAVEGAAYQLRVVALDNQRNVRTSAVRTVSVAHDDASGVFLSPTDPAYVGEWEPASGLASPYRGTLHTTSDAGAYFRAGFAGTHVAWFAPTGPAFGRASVSIDGGAWTAVSLAAPADTARSLVFERDVAAPGPHTIRIRRDSGQVAIDGLALR